MDTIGISGMFAIFAASAFASFLYSHRYMPETYGLSILELEMLYKDSLDDCHGSRRSSFAPNIIEKELGMEETENQKYLDTETASRRASVYSIEY